MVEFDNMELMVGKLDSLLDIPGTEKMLAFELVATFDLPGDMWTAVDLLAVELATSFDSLDEPLEAVMTGTMGLVAGLDSLVAGLDSLAAGFDALDDAFETVVKRNMGLVADDTMGAVDMLDFELAGHLDGLEDISGTLGT
jgi:hypothetical protein